MSFSNKFSYVEKSPKWRKCANSGHSVMYVMIIIFRDLCQDSAKKFAFFSKTSVVINFLQKLAVVRAKNAKIFAKFFGENILKIMTSVPGWKLCKSSSQKKNAEAHFFQSAKNNFLVFVLRRNFCLAGRRRICRKKRIIIIRCTRVARWYAYFHTKITILGIFFRVVDWRMLVCLKAI
jgi:hypothetical protein